MTSAKRTGVPLVVSAPSGGGKTTLCQRLVDRVEGVEISISHTTRAPRGDEEDGVHYHFVNDDKFAALVAQDAFLEWAVVHSNRYGTSKRVVGDMLARGVDVLFDIDVQGGRQIAERLEDAVLVFILPPDMETLEGRLRGRGSDSDSVIANRLEAAKREIEQASFYTHWIVNDDLERAFDQLRSVLVAERLKRVDRRALIEPVISRSKP